MRAGGPDWTWTWTWWNGGWRLSASLLVEVGERTLSWILYRGGAFDCGRGFGGDGGSGHCASGIVSVSVNQSRLDSGSACDADDDVVAKTTLRSLMLFLLFGEMALSRGSDVWNGSLRLKTLDSYLWGVMVNVLVMLVKEIYLREVVVRSIIHTISQSRIIHM